MTNADIPIVILCGGQGTRMREETEYRPKPMVDIGGYPILWHIMKIYAAAGFKKFILCLGYKGQMIKEYFLNYRSLMNDFEIDLGTDGQLTFHTQHDEDFKVTLVDTGLTAMTGARISRIKRHIDTDTFMVTYGDGLSDINIADLLAFHRSSGTIGTVTTIQPTSRFGVIEFDSNNRVLSFKEKPKLAGWTSAGFFVFDRRFFDYLDDQDSCVLEQAPLVSLAAAGQLTAFPHNGFFFAMDTYREYIYLNDLWRQGDAPWHIW